MTSTTFCRIMSAHHSNQKSEARSVQMRDASSGALLLVIPPVVRMDNGIYEVESDFANNLKLYLENFTHVTFACPAFPRGKDRGVILRSVRLDEINHHDRLSYIALPYTYREDRYFRHYIATKRLLRSQIDKADYLVFSP